MIIPSIVHTSSGSLPMLKFEFETEDKFLVLEHFLTFITWLTLTIEETKEENSEKCNPKHKSTIKQIELLQSKSLLSILL